MLQNIRTPVASWQQDTSAALQNEWRGAYWFLVERLNVCDPLDELGAETSVILKQVVNTQVYHQDLVELIATRQWSFGFLKMLEFHYQMRNCQLPRKDAAAYSEIVNFNLPISYLIW
jgi:hypothetical protein